MTIPNHGETDSLAPLDTQADDDIENRKSNQAIANDKEDDKCCRICLDTDNAADMIAPCACKGSSKWVHRACLDEWRAYNANDLAFSQCMECKKAFSFEEVAASNDTMQRQKHVRRLLYWFLVSRDLILVTVLLQVVILFFALVFWLIARNEEGVVEWTSSDEHSRNPCAFPTDVSFGVATP